MSFRDRLIWKPGDITIAKKGTMDMTKAKLQVEYDLMRARAQSLLEALDRSLANAERECIDRDGKSNAHMLAGWFRQTAESAAADVRRMLGVPEAQS